MLWSDETIRAYTEMHMERRMSEATVERLARRLRTASGVRTLRQTEKKLPELFASRRFHPVGPRP